MLSGILYLIYIYIAVDGVVDSSFSGSKWMSKAFGRNLKAEFAQHRIWEWKRVGAC